jgi:hypothetical protein
MSTATATSTSCPFQFTDVPASNDFYPFIRCLACRGIISGYNTAPPCPAGQTPCFLPSAKVTRGQTAKIVSNAAGFNDAIPSTRQTFVDVPNTNPFWLYIERLTEPQRGYISGYNASPPCPAGQVPCFLPYNNVTRSQIAKIDANAAGYADSIPPTQQTFQDVPNANVFWVYIERARLHGVIGGYTGDGTTVNACTGQAETAGLLYFRGCTTATRGQTAKIVANTFYPDCQTP